MAHATVADYEAYVGETLDAKTSTRVTQVIPWAERDVKFLAGQDFFDSAAPFSDASQDWLIAVSMIVERYLGADDPQTKAARLGPYQSEQIGDYRYQVKPDATNAMSDTRVAWIIGRNSYRRTTKSFTVFAVAGPQHDVGVDRFQDW